MVIGTQQSGEWSSPGSEHSLSNTQPHTCTKLNPPTHSDTDTPPLSNHTHNTLSRVKPFTCCVVCLSMVGLWLGCKETMEALLPRGMLEQGVRQCNSNSALLSNNVTWSDRKNNVLRDTVNL